MPPSQDRSERLCIALTAPLCGGSERAGITLANHLAVSGVAVRAVFINASGPLRETIGPEVEVVDLRASRVATGLPALCRSVSEHRADIVLSVGSHLSVPLLAAAAAGRLATRVVPWEGGRPMWRVPGRLTFKDRLLRRLMSLLYRRADHVVAVEDTIARDMVEDLRVPPERVSVLPCPMDIAAITSAADAVPDHPWLAHKDRPVVLAVGRLVRVKGYETLLEAFARARRQRPLRLVILGDGPDRERLVRLTHDLGLQEDVSLPGTRANPYPFMRRADVFVSSSISEGFSVVIAEALACGCNVVATASSSGPATLLLDGRLGDLVPVGGTEPMAAAILQRLDDPLPITGLRDGALRYDAARVAGRYRSLLLSGRGVNPSRFDC